MLISKILNKYSSLPNSLIYTLKRLLFIKFPLTYKAHNILLQSHIFYIYIKG